MTLLYNILFTPLSLNEQDVLAFTSLKLKKRKRMYVELCQITAINNTHPWKLYLNDKKTQSPKKYISIKYYFL